LSLARQCRAMADALESPKGDQSAKPELSEPDILLLLDRVLTEQKITPTATADRPEPPRQRLRRGNSHSTRSFRRSSATSPKRDLQLRTDPGGPFHPRASGADLPIWCI